MSYSWLAFSLILIVPACTAAGRPDPRVWRDLPRLPTWVEAEARPASGGVAGRRRGVRGGPVGVVRMEPAVLEGELVAAANGARRRAGVRPLAVDAALVRAARRYAKELAGRREIEHVSATPGRRTFRDRIEAEGVRPRIAGENLARLTAWPEHLPGRVVELWLESRGHRANLLERIFTRTGVGVWLGRDEVWYVVQVYATGS